MLNIIVRVGEASISTLDQWNDALHLSSKWGFDDIRVTSLAAIEPLASAVDKIVLGRLYDFSKWVPDAYVDLLEREESLTVEEARRMPIEDVVTIARGRCEARTAKTRPRAEIESVVKGLLSVGDPPPSPHPLPVPEAPTPPSLAEDTGKEADVDWQSVHQVSRWVIQYENKQSGTAARACLVQWLHEDPIPRIGLFLDSALKRALLSWLETSTPKLQGSRIKLWDWKIYAVQRDLHALPGSTCPMLYNSPLAQEAGGRLVDSWSTLLDLPLDETVECITETKYWKGMSARTNFLAYCVGCRDDDGVFFMSAAVFAPFWTTITLCYTTAAENHKHITARLIHKLLCDVRQSVSKTAVCREMDAFYMTIEQACDKAFLEEGNALADVLKVRALTWKSTQANVSHRISSTADTGHKHLQYSKSQFHSYML
jgi:hypothetical protein